MRRLLLLLGVAVLSSGLTAGVLALQARSADEPARPTLHESFEEVRECLRERGVRPRHGEAFGRALQECGAPLRERALPALAEQRDAFLADVAARLGVTVDELRAAVREAALAQVDRLVEDGAITEEKGERLKRRIELGAPFLLGPAPLRP